VLFLSCKANARVKLASRGTDRISCIIVIVFCVVIVIVLCYRLYVVLFVIML
jgi:hypothetical protein